MAYQLEQLDYHRVRHLIENTAHELSIEAVIAGNAPGEVYVDDPEQPSSVLIKTPECNVCAGDAENAGFNKDVREIIGFFDQITCDNAAWESNIHRIHPNIAVRCYTRRAYQLDKLEWDRFADVRADPYVIEYVTTETLKSIDYLNSDKIRDWFNFTDFDRLKDYSLGAYVRKGDEIVSWSLVDCIVGDNAEIGVKTDPRYRRKGLGTLTAAAAVRSCFNTGISRLGWHCVDTNIGSRRIAEKIGFRCIRKYGCFTPFPPIENISDLDRSEWIDWALYYEKMNLISPDYYWLAATCWAKASMLKKTIDNIQKLAETGQTWFYQYLSVNAEFHSFADDEEWQRLIDSIRV